jgi:periplasmic divalent cation tolerance protein
MTEAIQIETVTGDPADAERIAASLVAKRLAACVQVNGPVDSTYRWKGQVETSQEWRCLIKTTRARFADVEQTIREIHSYEVPEIIATPIVLGSTQYLEWLEDAVSDGE